MRQRPLDFVFVILYAINWHAHADAKYIGWGVL